MPAAAAASRRSRRRRGRCWPTCRRARGTPASASRRRCAAMCLPTAVEPVNEIMSTRGSPVSTSPTSAGSPDVTTLNDAGRDVGLLGDELADPRRRVRRVGRGLQDHACIPAASAGASFDRLSMNGKFHGVIAPTTPIGSSDDQPVRRHAEELVRPELVLPLVAVDEVDVPLHVVDAAVLLHRVGEPDRRTDLGDDLRPQLFLVLARALPSAAGGPPCAARGSSPSRSRRTPDAPRRSRAPCRRRDASATGPMTASVAGLMLS